MTAPRGAQAATRALQLLKDVAGSSNPLSLTDLATRHDLARSTTHRLLAALESEGFVTRDPRTSAYLPGAELVTMALQTLPGASLISAVRPRLQELTRESGETATLELRVGREIVIVDEVTSRRLVVARSEVGTRWPLHRTSTGRALLAALPPVERTALLADIAAEASDTETRRKLEAELPAIASTGFAVARDLLEEGYSAVGAAILGDEGLPIAALSLGGPSERLNDARLRQLGRLVASVSAELSVSINRT